MPNRPPVFDRDSPVPDTPAPGGHHAPARRPLRPTEVAQRLFPVARRGLDPTEVYAFLARVAADLAAARAEAARTRDENALVKSALRDWQSRFAPRVLR